MVIRYSYATKGEEADELCLQRGCSILQCAAGMCKDDPKTEEIENLPGWIGQTDPEGNITSPKNPINPRKGKQVDNCSKDCGSYFDPREWGCYLAKVSGGCGGSTGFCDMFGAGEICTKYAKYAMIGIGVIIAILLVKRFR